MKNEQCKMDKEEEIKPRFGSDYVGDVFDHTM